MHFKYNENKINNWEAVYKNLIFKVIHRIGGKRDRSRRWLRDQVRWRGQVPLGDKVGGIRRELSTWTAAGRIYMVDRPRESNDWEWRGDLGVAKDRNFVTQLGIRRGRRGPYKGEERERQSMVNGMIGDYRERLCISNLNQGLKHAIFIVDFFFLYKLKARHAIFLGIFD